MKNQIVFLVVALGLLQLVNCKCSTGLELDCFFGEDSSGESSSKGDDSLSSAIYNLTQTLQNSLLGHGNSQASASLSADALANLNQIPSIVSHLNKLTNVVTGVEKKLSKNRQSNEKYSKSSDETNDGISSKSSNSKEISSLKELMKEWTKRLEKVEKGVAQPADKNTPAPEPDSDESTTLSTTPPTKTTTASSE